MVVIDFSRQMKCFTTRLYQLRSQNDVAKKEVKSVIQQKTKNQEILFLINRSKFKLESKYNLNQNLNSKTEKSPANCQQIKPNEFFFDR